MQRGPSADAGPQKTKVGNWRNLRLQQKSAYLRFPAVRRADLNGSKGSIRDIRSLPTDVRQSAPAWRSLYRLALVFGIMIPHRCLSNAENISGRFVVCQRLEVARQRRHNGGCDVGRRPH
jgi:hypothetical protein